MLKIIKRIFKKEKLGSIDNLSQIKSGKINRVFLVNNKFIIKFATQKNRGFAKQIFIVKFINNIPLAPIIAYNDQPDKNYFEYIIEKKLPGENLAYLWPSLDKSQQENIFYQMIEMFRKMHSYRFNFYGDLVNMQNQYSSWSIFYKNHFQQAKEFAIRSNKKEKFLLDQIDNYYQKNKSVLNSTKLKPVFCHADLIFTNILVDRLKISGILDFDLSLSAPFDFEFEIPLTFYNLSHFFLPSDIWNKYPQQLSNCNIWLQKYYPELYRIEDIKQRLNLYHLARLMEMLYLSALFGYDEKMKKAITTNIKLIIKIR